MRTAKRRRRPSASYRGIQAHSTAGRPAREYAVADVVAVIRANKDDLPDIVRGLMSQGPKDDDGRVGRRHCPSHKQPSEKGSRPGSLAERCDVNRAEVMREGLHAATNKQPPTSGHAQCDEHNEQGEVPEPRPALIVVDGISDQPGYRDDRRRDSGRYARVHSKALPFRRAAPARREPSDTGCSVRLVTLLVQHVTYRVRIQRNLGTGNL